MNAVQRAKSCAVRWFAAPCGLLWFAVSGLASHLLAAEAIDFDRQIAPLLVSRCFECHHGDTPQGGLNLARHSSVLQGGDSGPALDEKQPEASSLWQRIEADEMPPKQPLSADEKELVRQWIQSGARWGSDPIDPYRFSTSSHAGYDWWSLQPVRNRPAVGEEVRREPAASSVDHWIRAKLAEHQLQPAPSVDERTWLRRVNFALVGLPPTPEEIRVFLSESPETRRASAVDRLLASPRFGERWARHWMDLMRYAESRGHESDFGIANAWQYRDYLVRAFNEDVPYDQFLSEHLAGDLMASPRLRPGTLVNESVLGTGWAFLGEEVHSPVDIRQDECDRVDNKVDVFTKSFLGMTVACARCHDHKFDPIRAKDYYSLVGFVVSSSYRQVRFEAMENNRRQAETLQTLRERYRKPLQTALAQASRGALTSLQNELASAITQAAKVNEPVAEDASQMERVVRWSELLQQAADDSSSPLHPVARALKSPNESIGVEDPSAPDASQERRKVRMLADYGRRDGHLWKVDGELFGPHAMNRGALVFGESSESPLLGVMRYGAAKTDRFWRHLRNAPDNENDSGRLMATARAGRTLRTPSFTLESGRLHYLVRGKGHVYAAVDSHLMIEGPLHGQLMLHFDTGNQATPSWVSHDLTLYAGHRTHIEFGVEGDASLEVLQVIEAEHPPEFDWEGDANKTRVVDAKDALSRPETLAVELARDVVLHLQRACDALETDSLSEADGETVAWADWLIKNRWAFHATSQEAYRLMADEFLQQQQAIFTQVQWESHTAVAWLDGSGVDEYVLLRGKPFQRGPIAPRSLPEAFGPSESAYSAESSGRLELARQLTHPDNPLVSRVAVNRVWHHLFGRGLVSTVDNFGALGERPTHPELLDELAYDFIHKDRWSLKRLVRRLVLSDTFAMDSRIVDHRAEEVDPTNAMLHRMRVRRLEAEAIRDSLLAISGRLNGQMFGRPVPVHLTEFVVGRGRPEESGPLDGDGRRSVYIALRRNFLPTMMLAYDMPTPFTTIGRRNVTNVPAQSLVRMNDPLFEQESRRCAERLLRDLPQATARERVDWLFEMAYGRMASDEEAAECLGALDELLREIPAQGTQNVEAWSQLCHALLNANEFIYLR